MEVQAARLGDLSSCVLKMFHLESATVYPQNKDFLVDRFDSSDNDTR